MQAPLLASGTIVGGDFRVVELLGAGGMGTVYVAEQLSTGKRRALKVMRQGLEDDPKQRQRFVREAKVGALVDSAHVVDVIAAGVETDSGMPWIAMELLEGEDLAAYVAARGPLPFREVLRLYQQLCHALSAAHDAGVVHRDIKPENVFVARAREATGRRSVKVLDFGIAKLVEGARSGQTTAIGSPAWMAPEQADPDEAITPASDVWALGLLAFWMLTGRSYWRNVDGAIRPLLKEILFDALPPASRRAAELGVEDRLVEGFDAWFERCVHRESRARFRNARELYGALRTLAPAEEPADEPGLGPTAAEPAEPDEVETATVSTRSFVQSRDLDVPSGKDDEAPAPDTLSAGEQTPASPRGVGAMLAAIALVAVLGGAAAWGAFASDPTTPAETGVAPAETGVAPSGTAPSDEQPPPAPSSPSAAPSVPSSAPPVAPAALPKAPPASPKRKPRAFERKSMEVAAQHRANSAERVCRGHSGPDTVAATLVFEPSGRIREVKLSGSLADRHSGAAQCVVTLLQSLHAPSYEGGTETVSVVVNLR